MSAGAGVQSERVSSDLDRLAPLFANAVRAAITECRAAGLDAMVFEAYRSQKLQAIYYARGRTTIPPIHTVTNAPTNLHSWHGYGLAVDIVHRTLFWKPEGGEKWFKKVAVIFKRNNCSWGGDWRRPDLPHFQWHLCKPSPSEEARRMIMSEGQQAVWKAVSAI